MCGGREGFEASEADPQEFGDVDVDVGAAEVTHRFRGLRGDEAGIRQGGGRAGGAGLLVELELPHPLQGVAFGHAVGASGFEGGGEVVGVEDLGEEACRGQADGARVEGLLERGRVGEQGGTAFDPGEGVAERAGDGGGVEALAVKEVGDERGFFEGCEVFAEEIFVKRGSQGLGVGGVEDDGGNVGAVEVLVGDVAAVAGDDCVAAVSRSELDRVDEAALGDGVREVPEFLRIHRVPELEVGRVDEIERNGGDFRRLH